MNEDIKRALLRAHNERYGMADDRYKPTRMWSRAMAGERRTSAPKRCMECGKELTREELKECKPASRWGGRLPYCEQHRR